MSADRPTQSGTNQAPQKALPGDVATKKSLNDESALVNLYRDITQENESQARNVLMFVIDDDEEANTRRPN
jgi:hypothetical protein